MNEESDHLASVDSDDELERSAVAGAVAVKGLIADRNNLRTLLVARERELAASQAAQEDLKRQFGLLHKSYVELAKKMVSQLHQFDYTLRAAITQRPVALKPEAASAERQFDGDGLPVRPQLKNGANGRHSANSQSATILRLQP